MPTSCAAYKCAHRSDKKAREQGITFHCFPKDLKRRKEWAFALKYQVNGKIWVPEHKTYLCSKHFSEEWFDRTGQTTRLRDGAVPSIFDFPPHMKKKVSVSGQRRREKQQMKNATKPVTSVPKWKTLTPIGSSQKVLGTPDSKPTTNLSEAVVNSKLTLVLKDNTTVNNVICEDLNAEKSTMGCEDNSNISTIESSLLPAEMSQNLSFQEAKPCKMRRQMCATSQICPTIRENSPSQHEKVLGKLQNSGDSSRQPQRLKNVYIVGSHPRSMLHNLALLWKDGKFCDAGIGNENATVMVHKVVLLAMCPKLLSMPSADISSSQFLRVNFPKGVSQLALDAFADYMYNGILDVDPQILNQLRTVAICLEMEELKLLCDTHLSRLKSPRVHATCESNVSVDAVNDTLSWPCCSAVKSSSLTSLPSVQSILDVKLSTIEPLLTSSWMISSSQNPVLVSDHFEENHSPSSYLPTFTAVAQPGVTVMDVSTAAADINSIIISNPDTQVDDLSCATSDSDVSNINTSVPASDPDAVVDVIDSAAAVSSLGVVISGLDIPVTEASSVTITNSGVTVTDLGVVINNLDLPITDLCVPVTNLGITVSHPDVTDLGVPITDPGVIDPCVSIKNQSVFVADSCINVTTPHVTLTNPNDNDVNLDANVTNLTVPVVDVIDPVDNLTDPDENVTEPESSITHQNVNVSDPDTSIINPGTSVTDPDTITNLGANVCDPADVSNLSANDIDPETSVTDPGVFVVQ